MHRGVNGGANIPMAGYGLMYKQGRAHALQIAKQSGLRKQQNAGAANIEWVATDWSTSKEDSQLDASCCMRSEWQKLT